MFPRLGDELRARREARAAGRKREGREDSIFEDCQEWRDTMRTSRARKMKKVTKWTHKDRIRWRIQWGWKRVRMRADQLDNQEKMRTKIEKEEAKKEADKANKCRGGKEDTHMGKQRKAGRRNRTRRRPRKKRSRKC